MHGLVFCIQFDITQTTEYTKRAMRCTNLKVQLCL